MELSYQLTVEDALFTQRLSQLRIRKAVARVWYARALLWGFGACVAVTFAASLGMYQSYPGKIATDFSYVFVPLVLGSLLLVAFFQANQRSARQAYFGALGPWPLSQCISVGGGSFEIKGLHGQATLPLSSIVEVSETPTHVLVVVRPWTVFAIPVAAFQSHESRAQFISLLGSGVRP